MKNENSQELLDKLKFKDKEIADLKFKLESIQYSRSWRYTSWLRFSGNALRALKKAFENPKLIPKTLNFYKKNGLTITLNRVFAYQNGGQKIHLTLPNRICLSHPLRLEDLESFVASEGGSFYKGNPSKLSKNSRYVLLVSHEASLTGAPFALRNLATVLIDLGITPIFLSPSFGRLIDECVKDGITCIVLPTVLQHLESRSDFLLLTRNLFEFIVINTLVSYPCVSQLIDTDTPVLWWIHESEESYSKTVVAHMPSRLSSNIHVFAGGDYAKQVLLKYRPNYLVGDLIYPTPEAPVQKNPSSPFIDKKGKVLFVCAASIQKRKAQTILVKAISTLDKNTLNDCLFLFVGKSHDNTMLKEIESAVITYPNNVIRFDEVAHSDLLRIYEQMDVLVCPSIDDPLPIVITDALCRSKLVICSDLVGSAPYLKSHNAAIIYNGLDPYALGASIKKSLQSLHFAQELRKNARLLYENLFSSDAFTENFKTILSKFSTNSINTTVSVIIPTYNGGKTFGKLLKTLRNQKGLSNLEIIVVDSGSKDETLDLCQEYNTKLVQIENKDFSHSHARNLGASHATNDILLFMTQDALPSSETWIRKLIDPLLNEKIAAVSAIEQCPDSADLFYKCLSGLFSNYLRSANPVCSLISVHDGYSLRQNSSLNDTNCAIKRSIFMNFKYQLDYAEDLNLGINLIKKGYFLKYIRNNPIIHGHNRNSFYYFKRSFVQTQVLIKLNVFDIDKSAVDDIRNNFLLISKLHSDRNRIVNLLKEDKNIDNIIKRLEIYLESLTKQVENKAFCEKNLIREIPSLYEFIFSLPRSENLGTTYSFKSLLWFSQNIIFPLVKEKYQIISNNLVEQILTCFETYAFNLLGQQLAIYDLAHGIDKDLKKYLSDGV